MARSLNPLSNFIRRTSRIFRIDNLSVGMDTSLLKRGAIGRLDCRRTRLPNRPHRTLTIPCNVCSRSRGLGAHDPVETALTIPWIVHTAYPVDRSRLVKLTVPVADIARFGRAKL